MCVKFNLRQWRKHSSFQPWIAAIADTCHVFPFRCSGSTLHTHGSRWFRLFFSCTFFSILFFPRFYVIWAQHLHVFLYLSFLPSSLLFRHSRLDPISIPLHRQNNSKPNWKISVCHVDKSSCSLICSNSKNVERKKLHTHENGNG